MGRMGSEYNTYGFMIHGEYICDNGGSSFVSRENTLLYTYYVKTNNTISNGNQYHLVFVSGGSN